MSSKASSKSTETAPKNLADETFRKGYKEFLEKAKNRKKPSDLEWKHKSNCLYHDIYPICRQHFTEEEIAESKFKICQCGIFKNIIKKKCFPQYRIGLNEVVRKTGYKEKKAHFEDLKLKINNQQFTIQLLKHMAGEIKKVTQPNTRKDIIGTASFHDKSVWFCFNETYIEFRLKSRYTKEYIQIEKDGTTNRQDIANWWYQCWGVHGLREEKKGNLHCRQYISIHKNCYVEKPSLTKFCERIVMYFYDKNNERLDLEIQEKVQQRLEEYDRSPKMNKMGTNSDKNQETEDEQDEDILLDNTNNYNVDYSQNTTQNSQSQESDGSLSIDEDGVMSMKHEESSGTKRKKPSYNELESKIVRLEHKCKRLEKEKEELKEKNKNLSDMLYQATNGNNNGIELRSNSIVFTPPGSFGYLSHPQQSQNDEQPPRKKQKLNNGATNAYYNMQTVI